LFEPCLQKYFNLIKIKAYLDQVQQCFKLKYHCFAAYYLVCRQVIILIVYINANYDTAVYYLQTFCIITVAIHVWIQPYKSTTLNVSDGVILLTMVLVINLNAFDFSRYATIVIVSVLVTFPLLFALLAYLRSNLCAFVTRLYQKQRNSVTNTTSED